MKRQWLIIALLLTAALMLRLQIYLERTEQDNQEAQAELTMLDPDAITSIRIQRPSDTLVFEKKNDTWRMTQPMSVAAHPERMTELRVLSILDVLGSYNAEEMDLKRYGLEPPKLTVWLNDTRLDFGLANPATHRRYVKVNQKLHLIADNIYPILLLPANAFVLEDQTQEESPL